MISIKCCPDFPSQYPVIPVIIWFNSLKPTIYVNDINKPPPKQPLKTIKAAHNPACCSVYPNGEIASIINTETENTIPMDTEVIIAIHQNFTLVTTSFTPCQNGVLSNVAVVEGGTFGLLGIKKVGSVNAVEMPATIMS